MRNSWMTSYIWASKDFTKKQRDWNFKILTIIWDLLDGWDLKIIVKKYDICDRDII